MFKAIVFSGSHGVGKTSLFSRIQQQEGTEKMKFFKEFNTGLYNVGFSLNGRGYDTSEVIFSQLTAFQLGYETLNYYLNRNYPKIIILDRSCIDTYLYTEFFVKDNKSIKNQYKQDFDKMEKQAKEILNRKDILHILLPPFEDFESKKLRMDLDERNIIWDMFQEFFNDSPNQENVHISKGLTTEERLFEFYKLVYNSSGYKNLCLSRV